MNFHPNNTMKTTRTLKPTRQIKAMKAQETLYFSLFSFYKKRGALKESLYDGFNIHLDNINSSSRNDI